MAIGLQLLFGLPLIAGVSITVLDTILVLFLMNKGIRLMVTFIVSMVSIIGLSFLAELFITQPEIGEIVRGFEPSMLSGNALYIAIGKIGRAHVCTPVTNAHLVCRLLLEKQNTQKTDS